MRLKMLMAVLMSVMMLPNAVTAQTIDSILAGEARGSLGPASEVNVRDSGAVTRVRIGGVEAIRLRLDYHWQGGDLDWRRLGRPGFAQRIQFRETPRHEMRAGRDYWYSLSFLLPTSMPTVRGHTLQFFDLKHRVGQNGTVPTVQLAIANDGNLTVLESLSSRWRCGSYRNVTGGRTAACDRTERTGVLGPQSAYAGRWVQVVMRARWSNGTDGLFQMWIDGRPILGYQGDTLQGLERVQFKFGLYRHHMTGDPGMAEIFYSNVTRADTCAGLQGVDCARLAASAPRPGFQNVRRQQTFVVNELSDRN